MTDTKIEIPDYVTRAKPLADITRIAADLLKHADDSNLPAPFSARVSHGGQEISLGFPGCVQTFHTLGDWAERFGGTVTGEPYTHEDGRESVYCQVKFPYLGVRVDGYAFIPAGDLEASTA
jgi:hypothetical protein